MGDANSEYPHTIQFSARRRNGSSDNPRASSSLGEVILYLPPDALKTSYSQTFGDTDLGSIGVATAGVSQAAAQGVVGNVENAFNAAASFVPGQDYQGKDNGFSARAGFVFKLGKLEKSKERIEEIKNSNSKIKKDILNLSKNKKKNTKDIKALNKLLNKQTELLVSLEKDNQILKENNKLILSENEQLISRLEDLISRLEKIDKLAPTNFDISRK